MTPEQQTFEAVKAAPALTITGMTIAGYAVQEWLVLLTAFYTALQIGLLVRRMLTARRGSDECVRTCPAIRKIKDDAKAEL